MQYNSILIGIDEIWIKSENVRNKLINLLIKDIKRRINYDKVENRRGRIIIWDYSEKWINILEKIFGIKVIYPAFYLSLIHI